MDDDRRGGGGGADKEADRWTDVWRMTLARQAERGKLRRRTQTQAVVEEDDYESYRAVMDAVEREVLRRIAAIGDTMDAQMARPDGGGGGGGEIGRNACVVHEAGSGQREDRVRVFVDSSRDEERRDASVFVVEWRGVSGKKEQYGEQERINRIVRKEMERRLRVRMERMGLRAQRVLRVVVSLRKWCSRFRYRWYNEENQQREKQFTMDEFGSEEEAYLAAMQFRRIWTDKMMARKHCKMSADGMYGSLKYRGEQERFIVEWNLADGSHKSRHVQVHEAADGPARARSRKRKRRAEAAAQAAPLSADEHIRALKEMEAAPTKIARSQAMREVMDILRSVQEEYEEDKLRIVMRQCENGVNKKCSDVHEITLGRCPGGGDMAMLDTSAPPSMYVEIPCGVHSTRRAAQRDLRIPVPVTPAP
jgi:hypothetical protein